MSDSADSEATVDVERWRDELESKRAEKDEFFAEHPQSPIPPDERDDFDGLDYFEPDPTYRVNATAAVHEDPEVVLMDTTAGREMRYLRVATLEFDLEREVPRASESASSAERSSADSHAAKPRDDGDEPRARDDETLEDGTYELAAYQLESPNEEPLFVPFRDKTTGQQTYEGGRYMELSPNRDLADAAEPSSASPASQAWQDGDELVVDFNLAYSPFCAYSETFDCPLPPEENWLEVTIPAGERFE